MGANRTGLPWPRGYIDLERGRPMTPTVGAINSTIVDRYGDKVNLNLLDEKLYNIGMTLDAILQVLNCMADTNITKEDME